MADANKTDGPRQVEPDNIQPPPHYREGRRQVVTSDTARQGPLWAIAYWLGWF